MKFTARATHILPTFIGRLTQLTQINPWEPIPGNTVLLKIGRSNVEVTITEAAHRVYLGEVISLDLNSRPASKGKGIGDIVLFTYNNVFSCSRI